MSPLLLAAALAATPGADTADAVIGKVRITRAVTGSSVWLIADDAKLRVEGDMRPEVARLQSAKIELLGRREGEKFHVKDYRILDIGGGVKPTVGYVVEVAGGLALRDGDGEPIVLSINPRGKARLQKKIGAKIWVSGKPIVSGQLKVQRYGILRELNESSSKKTP